MLTFMNALASSPRGVSTPLSLPLSLPPQFAWQPSFSIAKAGSGYTTSYNPQSDKPSGTIVWVSTSGSDGSGDGSEASPYRTINAGRLNGDIVHIKAGFYEDNTAAFGINVTQDTAFIAIDGPGSVIWSSNQDFISWTLESGDVYRSTISSTVNDVIDLTYTRAGEFLKDGVTGLPDLYTEQASITDVQNNAGSFYYTGTTLYVHTHDGRSPDSDVKPMWEKAIWSPSGVNHTLYLEGIEFWGKQALYISGINGSTSSKVVAVDCAFRFAPALANAKCDTVRDVRMVRCEVSDAGEDGFSYTNLSTAFTQHVLEIDCVAKRCGRVAGGDFNNNCSTSHRDCNLIRINGSYDTAQGPVVADVQGSQTLNVNVTALNANSSNGPSHISSSSFSAGTYGDNDEVTRMWLIECSASGSGFDRGMSVGGVLISDANFSGGAGADSGIILSYEEDNTPVYYDDVTAWFDFDDDQFVELGTGGIVEMDDKSPKRRNARQNNTSQRLPVPAVKTGCFNGRKVSSTDDRTDEKSLVMLANITIGDLYIVTSYKDGTDSSFDSYETLVCGDGGNPRLMGGSGTADFYYSGGNDLVNGVSINGNAISNAALPLGFSIIRATPSSPKDYLYTLFEHSVNGSRGWTGDIAEVLVFETAKNATEDTALRAYLSNKWGIA